MDDMTRARAVWGAHSHEAQWEIIDFDEMTLTQVCDISLDIDGYQFRGRGLVVLGNKNIQSVSCATRKGVLMRII